MHICLFGYSTCSSRMTSHIPKKKHLMTFHLRGSFFQTFLCPEDIVKGTSQWKGIRVTVKLTIQNRQAKVRRYDRAASSTRNTPPSVGFKGRIRWLF